MNYIPSDPHDLVPMPRDLDLPKPGGGPTPPRIIPVPRNIKPPPKPTPVPEKPAGGPRMNSTQSEESQQAPSSETTLVIEAATPPRLMAVSKRPAEPVEQSTHQSTEPAAAQPAVEPAPENSSASTPQNAQ